MEKAIKEIKCTNCGVNLLSEDEPTIYLEVEGSETFEVNLEDKTLDFCERDVNDNGEIFCRYCNHNVTELFTDFDINY